MSLVLAPGQNIVSTYAQNQNNGTAGQIDAAGESVFTIGRMRWEDRGSHTISSAGGLIYIPTSSVTFNNAGTTARCGIQDVDLTTGLEDGTYDVSGDDTGGGGAYGGSTINSIAMDNGTKTIAHGDLIAVGIELTSRAGADSIQLRRVTNIINVLNFPYGTADTGAGPAKTQLPMPVLIIADDGTVGWIDSVPLNAAALQFTTTGVAFNSGSTPDEYIMSWSLPYPHEYDGYGMPVGDIDSIDALEFIPYTDPYGTPSAGTAVTIDPDVAGSAATNTWPYWHTLSSGVSVPINTEVGISIRPTNANNVEVRYYTAPSATIAGHLKKALPFSTIKIATRTNQTGAFSEISASVPIFFLNIDKYDDGTGGASGGGIRLAGHGGLAA